MNEKSAKIIVSGVAVALSATVVAHGMLQMNGPEIKKIPGPTVTTTVHQKHLVPVPGPTVTKKVVETKTVRPKVTKNVTRSTERETPKKTKAPVVSSGSAREIARQIFGSQFSCADALIQKESGWNVSATNPSSGAYGLPQALPGSKMASAGADWRTNPATQLKWLRSYVDSRYGGVCGAWAFWKSNHWY